MPDREKVIRAVDSCFDYWLDKNRYLHPLELEDVRQIKADALALLKEQESVEPKYNARTNWFECGACHYSMTSGMHCRSVLIPAYRVGFCAKCGKAVNWK